MPPSAQDATAPAQTGPVVVVGTSQGGLASLRQLLSQLPADFAAPLCIVQHIGRHPHQLQTLLSTDCALPLLLAESGMPLLGGHVYLPQPDRHTIVQNQRLQLDDGPRENFARPAIDPLFRSAAREYGASVIGVLLTGRLNDGTIGLYEIERHGGTAVVEDPATAEWPEMPQSAIDHVNVDAVLPAAAIGPWLTAELHRRTTGVSAMPAPLHYAQSVIGRDEPPAGITCPECGGVMREQYVGTIAQYLCHIGHRATAESVAHAQRCDTERMVDILRRALKEHIAVCEKLSVETIGLAGHGKWQGLLGEANGKLQALLALASRAG